MNVALIAAIRAGFAEVAAVMRARTPKITVGPTAPTNPAVGDVWIDTN